MGVGGGQHGDLSGVRHGVNRDSLPHSPIRTNSDHLTACTCRAREAEFRRLCILPRLPMGDALVNHSYGWGYQPPSRACCYPLQFWYLPTRQGQLHILAELASLHCLRLQRLHRLCYARLLGRVTIQRLVPFILCTGVAHARACGRMKAGRKS